MKIRLARGNLVSERRKAKKWTLRGILKVSHTVKLGKLHKIADRLFVSSDLF